MGLRCRVDQDQGAPLVGYLSEEPLAERLGEIAALGGSVMSVFHSTIEATDAALPIIREAWQGPIAVYPEADRPDYVQRYKNHSIETPVTPEEFVDWAQACVGKGVQIIGGCCGIELEYIRPLRDVLPARLPEGV
jgi:S-methylmethionine-dependent homocysteine/selenocysteine methylase